MTTHAGRRAASVLACAIGLTLALTGCSTTGSAQRDLAARLERLDGVTDTTYTLTDSIFQLPVHSLKIIVDTSLTEEEARGIVEESCSPAVEIDDLTMTTNTDTLASRAVVTGQNGPDATTCLNDDELDAYALAVGVMNDLDLDYDGRFRVSLGGLDGTVPDALGIRTFASDRRLLIDALTALHDRYEGPIEFAVRWAKNGDEYTPTRPELTAHLSDTANLDKLNPILGAAFSLDAGDITVTDTTIAVELAEDTDTGAASTLADLANLAGVTLTITAPQ